VSDKTGILLIDVPHEACEHCGALAFEAEKKTKCS
jgi:ribosomal protein L37E